MILIEGIYCHYFRYMMPKIYFSCGTYMSAVIRCTIVAAPANAHRRLIYDFPSFCQPYFSASPWWFLWRYSCRLIHLNTKFTFFWMLRLKSFARTFRLIRPGAGTQNREIERSRHSISWYLHSQRFSASLIHTYGLSEVAWLKPLGAGMLCISAISA